MKTNVKNVFVVLLLASCSMMFAQQVPNKCGTWRWNVKTLTDKGGIDLLSKTPISTTIDKLVIVKPLKTLKESSPSDGKTPRYAREKQVVEIFAYVTKIIKEDDRDLHLVLKSLTSDKTMVGEIPDPTCPDYDSIPSLREYFKQTRDDGMKVWDLLKQTKNPVKVKITGVPFWDGVHANSPTGASKYFREIHPILTIVPE